MKSLIISLFLLAVPTLHADEFARTENESAGPAGKSKKIEWRRDGKLLLWQTIPESAPNSLVVIHNIVGAGANLTLYLKDWKVSGVSTHKEGFLLSLDDFTKDGVSDFLQIKDPGSGHVIEAFSIIDGFVAPLPRERMKPDRTEFYFDEEIIDYLKQKNN